MRQGWRVEEWDKLANLLATIRGIMGERVQAATLNPFRPKPKKTAAMLARENERAWNILDRELREIQRSKR